MAALGASGISAPVRAGSPSPACAPKEYLFEVLRDWRKAKQRGAVDTKTRLALCNRAFAVADVARGRERYEALRFIASLDDSMESAELLLARDRALERVIAEYIDEADIIGEFVLRVLRDDAHDRALRARVYEKTHSDSVRAACEFFRVEANLDRALELGEMAPVERDEVLVVLAAIGAAYGESKHPLSAKSWGEQTKAQARQLRDLVLTGEAAPEILGLDVGGRELRLTSLRGKAVLVCFWGDWCAPCRALYPRQRELRTKFAGRAFEILGINSDVSQATTAAVCAKEALAWPNLWDGSEGTSGPIASRWRIRAWPTWYLIDAQGIVRRRWCGAPDAQELDAQLEIWVPRLPR